MKKITPKDVAEYLGINEQAVRVRMQNGTLPIGDVVKNGTNYTYLIYPKALYETTGMKANGYEPPTVVDITVEKIADALYMLLKKNEDNRVS